MKLSDYLAEFLASKNIKDVFMVTGGGAMHLNNSLGKHPKLHTTYLHHEQSCAMAAESYARLSLKLAVVNVTTGPGGLNSLNGVFGAYTDSIPMLIISGQVKTETMVRYSGLQLRQLGDQEWDIVSTVKTMTKYAEVVNDKNKIKFYLEKALYLANSGRPGPVWLDIPLDIQGADIDPEELIGFDALPPLCPEDVSSSVLSLPRGERRNQFYDMILKKLSEAQRPVILIGTGVRISGQAENFLTLCKYLKIPVVTAFNAHDLIPDDHELYAGRPGTVGDRAGNFAVQNSDCLLVLGCRLNIRQIGYFFESFARAAYKIMVDIDSAELDKKNLNIDLKINLDLKILIPELINLVSPLVGETGLKTERLQDRERALNKSDWLAWCKARVKKYQTVLPEYFEISSPIHPYVFMRKLSESLPEESITVTGNATACVVAFQTYLIKSKTRLFSNSGSASMGYDLPAAIGAYVSSGQKVICLAGDGSIMMNLQELAQVRFKKMNIKIFLINNGGYLSIRQTQKGYFGLPYLGCGEDSELGFPDFKKLADAFNLNYTKLENLKDLENLEDLECFKNSEPVLFEVMCQAVPFSPKAASRKLASGKMVSKPLEDLAPFLPFEELMDNLLIPPILDPE